MEELTSAASVIYACKHVLLIHRFAGIKTEDIVDKGNDFVPFIFFYMH